MPITLRDNSSATELTDFYNEQITPIPYCPTVTPEEFELGFHFRINPWPEEDNTDRELAGHSERKLIVAEENGEIVGFADVGKQIKDDEAGTEVGLIRVMMYRPGHRRAGQSILEQAEQYFRDLGLSRIEAFTGHKYSFFRLGSGALPQSMGHVQALFGVNGYQFAKFENDGKTMGWFFFHWPEYRVSEPSPPDPSIEIAEKIIPGRGELPHLEIKAFREGELMAYTWSSSVESYGRNPDMQTTLYTDYVRVVEPGDQGKGWGRYLLERSLWEMKKRGYRNAVLSGSLSNYRGHLLYTNLGYRVVDSSCAFVKDSGS